MEDQWQWIGNLITAIATVTCVLIAQMFTRKADKKRAHREDATRWLQDRRHAYVEFLAAVTRMREVTGYTAMCELGSPHHPTIEQRRRELSSAHEFLHLIAPAGVLKQSDRVCEALDEYWSDSRDKMSAVALLPDRVDSGRTFCQEIAVVSILDAVIAFREAARQDLGIEHVDVPPDRLVSRT